MRRASYLAAVQPLFALLPIGVWVYGLSGTQAPGRRALHVPGGHSSPRYGGQSPAGASTARR